MTTGQTQQWEPTHSHIVNAAGLAAPPTCLLVLLVRTISSSGITCAGLKKCAPTMRSCALVVLPTMSMSMVLVLVDRMQSGLEGGRGGAGSR